MKIKRLVTALSLSLAVLPAAEAARYRIVELPLEEEAVHSFSASINNSGDMAATITSAFNPPIKVSLLNFEDQTLIDSLTDPEGVQAGNINAIDMLTLYNLLEQNEGNAFFQQFGDTQSFKSDGSSAEMVNAFDVFDAEVNGPTESITTVVTDMNNASVLVGTSQDPFYSIEYTNESDVDITYIIHDFANYGFVDFNGEAYPLLPVDTTLGGYSEATGVNDSLQITGFGSIEALDSINTSVANCDDPETRGDQPVEVCYQAILSRGITGSFVRRGLIWQVDEAGNTLSTQTLGILLTPNADEERRFASRATAINNNGIAVGSSDDYYRDTTEVREFAAIFDGEEVIGITDHEQYFSSAATDINDSNVVVGFAFRTINGLTRSKFFYHDMNTGETTYPADFFNSSASLARAINNNGLIVGEGDVEISSSSQRRKNGYVFDINSGDFANLNDLLSCDTDITIVQAIDINDNNEIAAIGEVYRQRRDITGTLETDENGDPIMQNKTIAVKLIPIPGGEVDDCRLVEETYERQGASLYYLLLPLGLLFTRRVLGRNKR